MRVPLSARLFPALPPVTHPAGDERRTLCVRNTCEGGGGGDDDRTQKMEKGGSSFLSLRFLQHQEMRRARPAFPPLRKRGEISFPLLPTFPPGIPGISPGTAVNFAVVDGSFLSQSEMPTKLLHLFLSSAKVQKGERDREKRSCKANFGMEGKRKNKINCPLASSSSLCIRVAPRLEDLGESLSSPLLCKKRSLPPPPTFECVTFGTGCGDKVPPP